MCGRGLTGSSHCVLCLSQEETLQHMFVECKYTKEVWSLVLIDIEHSLIDIFPALISFHNGGEYIKVVSIKKQVLKGFGNPSPSILAGAFGCPRINIFLKLK